MTPPTVMGRSEGILWAAPRDLATLAAQPHAGWIRGIHSSRPGSIPRTGPEHVLSPVPGMALRVVHKRIQPVLEYLNGSEKWLTRSWSTGVRWSHGDNHTDERMRVNAIFGYCDSVTADRLRLFADRWIYGITVHAAAPSEDMRVTPAPTAYVGGQVDTANCIGWHRTAADIAAEWEGCNPLAIETIAGALQVTLWDPHGPDDRLWKDIATFTGAGYPGRS